MRDLPVWLRKAETYVGQKEIKGGKHNPKIVEWWSKIRAPFTDDETPWCAAFVGGVLEECGIKSSRSAAARSYTKWGQKLLGPVAGCVVVFWRGSPTGPFGHVGFVVGKDQFGNLMVLGGNQGDCVSIKAFASDRVLSYHWPISHDVPAEIGKPFLPVFASDGKLSTNEA